MLIFIEKNHVHIEHIYRNFNSSNISSNSLLSLRVYRKSLWKQNKYFQTKNMSGIDLPFTYVVKHTNILFRIIEIILPWGENV